MDVVASIIAIAALIGLFVIVRRRPKSGNVRPQVHRKAVGAGNSSFHAVSIKYAADACEAARNMHGRRFLSSAAPRLPLPECDAQTCKCRFVHHKDRRNGDDRRNPWGQGFGSGITGNYPKEQREGGDRRRENGDNH